jgi:hypothetical protein
MSPKDVSPFGHNLTQSDEKAWTDSFDLRDDLFVSQLLEIETGALAFPPCLIYLFATNHTLAVEPGPAPEEPASLIKSKKYLFEVPVSYLTS